VRETLDVKSKESLLKTRSLQQDLNRHEACSKLRGVFAEEAGRVAPEKDEGIEYVSLM
jgi:hypothetical protein